MTTRMYKSEPLSAVHDMMEGLRQGGAIDERTMREFDAACLAPAGSLEADLQRAPK